MERGDKRKKEDKGRRKKNTKIKERINYFVLICTTVIYIYIYIYIYI